MQSKLRVLLITRECLRTDSNEGNVLINLFENQPMELANIYCKPGVPDVDMCHGRYSIDGQDGTLQCVKA
jgi:hypothetical protein